MARPFRILGWVLGIVLLLGVLTLAFVFLFIIRRPFPQTNGTLHLSGLDGPVDIYRDRYGIPQIYASTEHDLFFAQGYIHAQDRFWQMDLWRHVGSGRTSEMFGEGGLKTDKFLRTLGWARVVRQELDQMDPASLAVLNAYADGVNAYLAGHQGSQIGLEYAILGLMTPGYQPEPWQPLHTLTWAKAMAWDLRGNMDQEIERAILLKDLSPEQVAQLFPPYPDDHPVIVPNFQVSAGQGYEHAVTEPADSPLAQAYPALSIAHQRFASLDSILGPSSGDIGSNNWVISGSRTASGKPFLANDMHLGVQLPSIWYENGLHCAPKGPDCQVEVTGFSFAGTPGVIAGHNDRIAWGLTNVGPDVMDLYIERINPENPNQYEVDGKWVDMDLVQETIQVAGGNPADLTVRYTRHGPIISDSYGALEDFGQKAGIDLPQNYAIALRWTALEPTRVVSAIFGLDRAQNWEDFRRAAQDFAVPAQNLVYADVDGNIGYQTPGRIPIRKEGHDGRLPVPGWTDNYEWQGYIPFEQLPHTFNPSQGYVATANNAVVSGAYPYSISTSWDYGYRAERIVTMIENAPGPIDADYIHQMHGDNTNLNAAQLTPILLGLQFDNPRLAQVQDLLRGWDYRNDRYSAPAAIFEVFWKHLLALTFHDDLPEDYWPTGDSRWFAVVGNLIQQPDSPWWANRNHPALTDRDSVFKAAFTDAVKELESSQGSDPRRWAWGDLHTVTFRNSPLGEPPSPTFIQSLLNRGPYRTSGGRSIVNATGWDATDGYEVISLPSEREIVDLSNLDKSQSINTLGESGHSFHPHYSDQANLWRTIRYHPMPWERATIERGAESHLRLMP